MKELATHEGRVENGDVTLPSDEGISDQGSLNILLPDLDPQRTYKIMSPRFAHPEEAKDFVKEPSKKLQKPAVDEVTSK